jgi:hypothetical protein
MQGRKITAKEGGGGVKEGRKDEKKRARKED